jgi:RNA polymerase sigma-70 factor (ECF subfamily)
VIAYALRRSSSYQDAADLVAETFEIAWRRLDSIPEGDAAIPWLLATARNISANRNRGYTRRNALTERLGKELQREACLKTPPESDVRLAAFSTLNRLSGKDRELLMLVGWDGLEVEQIAAIMGCSLIAVRIRLHRARSRLAALLAKDGLM